MNRIVFIVPYYGKLPNYFREWAFSAGYLKNQQIDFLLVTDIKMEFLLPENIHIYNISFEKLRDKIQKMFKFKIGLSTPYKLCDFKPTLGYVFEEEIGNYDFWGNCDIDQIWGDVRHFITESILDKYDRIQFLGHFILYRNNRRVNRLFKLPGAVYDYRKVLSDTMHYSFCEHSGMMKIVVDNGISNYLDINYADLSPRYTRMIISRQPNYDYQIIYWENGHIYRKYIDTDGEIGTNEYMYFHFQRKNPSSLQCWENETVPERIIYHADGFVESDAEPITVKYLKKNSDFKDHNTDKRENMKYKEKKILEFIKSPAKKKILWIKQKIATRKVLSHKEYFGKNYSNV